MIYLELTGSLALLLIGGEMLITGAVATAQRAGLSPLTIGITLVGFGTSTPELVTSLEAAVVGAPGIAVGNIIGSNIANILLILGLAALVYPVAIARGALYRDGAVVLVAAVCCIAVGLSGALIRPAGVLLVLALLGYIVLCYLTEAAVARSAAELPKPEAAVPVKARFAWPAALMLLLGGLALSILAAHLLVASVIAIGVSTGIAETVLGVTVVAVGTSLPELVTSVLAAFRRQPDIAFGNVVGSNIYNVFGILGVTAIVEPIPVPPELVATDMWVMLAATVLLFAFAHTGWRLSRGEGALLLLAYMAYLVFVTVN